MLYHCYNCHDEQYSFIANFFGPNLRNTDDTHVTKQGHEPVMSSHQSKCKVYAIQSTRKGYYYNFFLKIELLLICGNGLENRHVNKMYF